MVERLLKRGIYFKKLLKQLPKDNTDYTWCEQRVNSLKNILVCLYGSTGSLWNRYGNVIGSFSTLYLDIKKQSQILLLVHVLLFQVQKYSCMGKKLMKSENMMVFNQSITSRFPCDMTPELVSDGTQRPATCIIPQPYEEIG